MDEDYSIAWARPKIRRLLGFHRKTAKTIDDAGLCGIMRIGMQYYLLHVHGTYEHKDYMKVTCKTTENVHHGLLSVVIAAQWALH